MALNTMLLGIRVVVSSNAVVRVPARQHKKRHRQTVQYHKRVQKKWTKRWGNKETPQAYRMLDPVSGAPMLLVHPSIYEKMKTAMG